MDEQFRSEQSDSSEKEFIFLFPPPLNSFPREDIKVQDQLFT